MKGTYSFGLYSVWELQANNSFIYKKFDGLQLPCLCNQLAWDCACIYIYK